MKHVSALATALAVALVPAASSAADMARADIMNVEGAVIIHEHPDDHMTQPIGGAGGRIGCGIVAKM